MALTKEQAAKASAILTMMERGWPRTEATGPIIEGLSRNCDGVSVEAVVRACKEFQTGMLERDHTWAPQGAELAARARVWQSAIDQRDRKDVELHTGIINADFGQGRIDFRGLTREEQDRILANKGLDGDGKSLAYKPITEISAALAGDLARPAIPAPQMKRMGAA